jgi:hypothetical protein
MKMSEITHDVQRDIALTRERMSETIAELDARISHRVAIVKERLDVAQLVQDHPWAAVAVALGIGALLAGTGADAKAARATVRAAKAAPGATAGAARHGWDAAVRRIRGDANGDGMTDAQEAADDRAAQPGLTDRVRDTITRTLGVDELIGQMRTAAEDLARPASYAGQNVPRNSGQQM